MVETSFNKYVLTFVKITDLYKSTLIEYVLNSCIRIAQGIEVITVHKFRSILLTIPTMTLMLLGFVRRPLKTISRLDADSKKYILFSLIIISGTTNTLLVLASNKNVVHWASPSCKFSVSHSWSSLYKIWYSLYERSHKAYMCTLQLSTPSVWSSMYTQNNRCPNIDTWGISLPTFSECKIFVFR